MDVSAASWIFKQHIGANEYLILLYDHQYLISHHLGQSLVKYFSYQWFFLHEAIHFLIISIKKKAIKTKKEEPNRKSIKTLIFLMLLNTFWTVVDIFGMNKLHNK